MKTLASFGLLLFIAFAPSFAKAQQTVLLLWPHGAPETPLNNDAEIDLTKPTDGLIDGHRTVRLTNVSKPSLTVYQPEAERRTGTAALVFPGGGYKLLSLNGEGSDACDWLTKAGITCLLVKYRVPQPPGEAGHYPQDFADLEDAQQAMRLAKAHAAEWHINPAKIGVVGFSAGGNLAVLLSNHPNDKHIESTPAAHDIPGYTEEASGAIRITGESNARPAFTIAVYPAYLALASDRNTLNPVYTPSKMTPPTFLIAAENDTHYGFNSPLYYQALTAAHVPAELHMYASGGHGFGVYPPNKPEEHWTHLANLWLRSINMLPTPEVHTTTAMQATQGVSGMPTDCPAMPSSSPTPITPNVNPGAANSASVGNNMQPCPQ